METPWKMKSRGHVIKRKHTANAKCDLPGLVGEIVEPLTEARKKQHQTFRRYSLTALSDARADHAIMEMYREGILNVQRIPLIVKQSEEPEFEEWGN